MKEIISTTKAPGAIGPYSQAVKIGDFLYTSGQLPIDPATGEMPADVSQQAHMAIKNLSAILQEAGGSLETVVKTTVFIKDMNDFPAINEVYAQYFAQPYPARSCVEVARLPKDALIEIECVANLG